MKQLIVWIVIACLLLSGCGAPQKTQAVESQSGITFTDDLVSGRRNPLRSCG